MSPSRPARDAGLGSRRIIRGYVNKSPATAGLDDLLRRHGRAENDLSEDFRREADEIYCALSRLADKNRERERQQCRRMAGFRRSDENGWYPVFDPVVPFKSEAPDPQDRGLPLYRSCGNGTIVSRLKDNYFTVLTIFSNAAGLFIARSASTLRLSWMPLALTLPINSE